MRLFELAFGLVLSLSKRVLSLILCFLAAPGTTRLPFWRSGPTQRRREDTSLSIQVQSFRCASISIAGLHLSRFVYFTSFLLNYSFNLAILKYNCEIGAVLVLRMTMMMKKQMMMIMTIMTMMMIIMNLEINSQPRRVLNIFQHH